MATSEDESGGGFEPASQETYEEETRETQEFGFEEAAGGMRVHTLKPLEIVYQAQECGVQSILRGSIDKSEMAGDGEDTGIGPFMAEAIAPNVVSHIAYWGDLPDDDEIADRDVDEDAPTFDLSVLDEADMKRLTQAVMGQDPDGGDDTGN